MKAIYKTIAIVLLSGTGIGSIQAQNTTSQAWTLRQCIDYAIEHNIDIRQTANEAEQNKISVNTAKWARLPNLNGGVSQGWSWGRTASPKDNSYSDTNSASTGLNLSTNVPLFTGLQLSNQYSLAKLNLQAAIEDLNKAKEDIAINVTSAYLQVLVRLQQLVRVICAFIVIKKNLFYPNQSVIFHPFTNVQPFVLGYCDNGYLMSKMFFFLATKLLGNCPFAKSLCI